MRQNGASPEKVDNNLVSKIVFTSGSSSGRP